MIRTNLSVVFAAALLVGCVIVDNDSDGGEGGTGGDPTNGGGGAGANGGSGGTGGLGGTGGTGGVGGTGGEVNGGGGIGGVGGEGGTGGGIQCAEAEDCPQPNSECELVSCEADTCLYDPAAEGTLCGATDEFYCTANGECVECLIDADCPGVDEICNLSNECVDDVPLGGACGDNFCAGEAVDNPCFTCIQTNCQQANVACATDTVAGACTNCLEWVNGGNPNNFCAGSQAKAQALIDCACGDEQTIGECTDN